LNPVFLPGGLAVSVDMILFAALAAAFITVVAAGPATIAAMHRLKFGQTINTDAPQTHAAKTGTPTMGGALFVYGVAIASLAALLAKSSAGDGIEADGGASPIQRDFCAVLLVFAAHVALGFADDYLSIKRGKNLGLKARYKLLWQFVIAVLFAGYVYLVSPADSRIDVGFLHWTLRFDKWVYCAGVVVAMMGMSNCTNLTDGLDGLAAGLAVMALLGLSAIVLSISPGAALFGWALAGSCLGFLVYNGYPARIFMGDTGSLALGASLVAIAVIGHAEMPMLLLCLVFIAEGLSVTIQVISFKTTGKRVFRMSPLHHHFELLGWPETHVVQRFWIVGILLLCLAVSLGRG
jgi:phospho-N-acetylmuramoyl-pentapeptide-transferase